MKTKLLVIIIFILLFSFILTGCLPGDGKRTVSNPGNFITGIWHGWVAPLSVIVGIFNKDMIRNIVYKRT